jgi:hypothetical protein
MNKEYYIQYNVTTLNGLQVSSPLYRIIKTSTIDMEYNIKLVATSNEVDGLMEIAVVRSGAAAEQQKMIGQFVLSRSCIENLWEEIAIFDISLLLANSNPVVIYKDYTIEHNKEYIYGL